MNAGYRTIVADPPWRTSTGPAKGLGEGWSGGGDGQSRPLAYSTMTVEAISALPVRELADKDCALYLWTTNGFLHAAFHVLADWGFDYSTTLVWGKTPMGSGLGGCYGISTEFILYARKGSPLERYKQKGTGLGFGWKRVYDERGKPLHSAKPPELQDYAEAMNDGPRLEMFARRQRLGWDTWGDQALNHVEISA